MKGNGVLSKVPDTTMPVVVARKEQVRLLPTTNKRLRARLERFKVEPPPFAPVYDRIFVVPVQDERLTPDKTASGIYIPDSLKGKVDGLLGLLVGAGPRAVEQLYSHGITVGDIVLVARFSVWHQPYLCPESKAPATVMVLRASEVVASVDLMTAYEQGEMWLDLDAAEGTVELNTRDGERKAVDPPESDEGV